MGISGDGGDDDDGDDDGDDGDDDDHPHFFSKIPVVLTTLQRLRLCAEFA